MGEISLSLFRNENEIAGFMPGLSIGGVLRDLSQTVFFRLIHNNCLLYTSDAADELRSV